MGEGEGGEGEEPMKHSSRKDGIGSNQHSLDDIVAPCLLLPGEAATESLPGRGRGESC